MMTDSLEKKGFWTLWEKETVLVMSIKEKWKMEVQEKSLQLQRALSSKVVGIELWFFKLHNSVMWFIFVWSFKLLACILWKLFPRQKSKVKIDKGQ